MIFSLYPEISKEIIETLLTSTEVNGHSLINLNIAKDNDFKDQAKMLAEYCFYDYYIRGGKNYAERMLKAADIDYSYNKEFVEIEKLEQRKREIECEYKKIENKIEEIKHKYDIY